MGIDTTAGAGLLEIRVSGIIRDAEARELRSLVVAYLEQQKGQVSRFLVDATHLKVIAPDAADALLGLMKEDNTRRVRAAYVAGEGTAQLQLKRLIREARNEDRRLFADLESARAWLLE
jgi:stage II sporulation SpoAA-like protein